MPFKKVGPGKYKSPSGKTYTLKQVRAYYASDGWKHKRTSRPKAKRKKRT